MSHAERASHRWEERLVIFQRNGPFKFKIICKFKKPSKYSILKNVLTGRIWSTLYNSFRCCGCQLKFVLDCNAVQRRSVFILWSVISANFTAFHKQLPVVAPCLVQWKMHSTPLSGSLHGAENFKPCLWWTFHFLPVALSKIHRHHKYYRCVLSALVGRSHIDKTWKSGMKYS